MDERVHLHCPICGPANGFKIKYEEDVELGELDFAARKLTRHMHWRMLTCNGCGLVYSSPIILADRIQDLYRAAGFVNEPQLELMGQDYLSAVTAFFPPTKDGRTRLLEVGSANGFFLSRALDAGYDAWGIEPGTSAFNSTPQDFRGRVVNNFLTGDLFEPQSFDVVCSFQVFDHVLEPSQFLQQIRHYLKPGGRFIQIHHNINSPLPTLLGRHASTYDVEHIYLWSPATMHLILEMNGLKPVQIRPFASAYRVDHALRQLPLPKMLKDLALASTRLLRLNKRVVRVPIENMVCVSTPVS